MLLIKNPHSPSFLAHEQNQRNSSFSFSPHLESALGLWRPNPAPLSLSIFISLSPCWRARLRSVWPAQSRMVFVFLSMTMQARLSALGALPFPLSFHLWPLDWPVSVVSLPLPRARRCWSCLKWHLSLHPASICLNEIINEACSCRSGGVHLCRDLFLCPDSPIKFDVEPHIFPSSHYLHSAYFVSSFKTEYS
jgi:hypothetical protein